MVSGGFDLNLLVLDFPRLDRCSDHDWWPTISAFEAALSGGAKGAVVASMGENLSEAHCAALLARGIAPLCGITETMDAIAAACVIGAAWKRPIAPVLLAPAPEPAGPVAVLDEAEAKQLLAAHGLPVPPGHRVATVEDAVASARELGFPVALKALGLAHKSEHDAVRLQLCDPVAVERAGRDIAALGKDLYVERMVEGGLSELIVGVTRDPVFGPVMTIGTGGVLVELLADSVTLLLPSGRADIEAALRSLKLFPLLDGYRGRKRADLDAALDAIVAIGDFALAQAGRLDELDINPLIVCVDGAFVADALMVVRN
jgi:acetate---CoA ligase (ADP-forming)